MLLKYKEDVCILVAIHHTEIPIVVYFTKVNSINFHTLQITCKQVIDYLTDVTGSWLVDRITPTWRFLWGNFTATVITLLHCETLSAQNAAKRLLTLFSGQTLLLPGFTGKLGRSIMVLKQDDACCIERFVVKPNLRPYSESGELKGGFLPAIMLQRKEAIRSWHYRVSEITPSLLNLDNDTLWTFLFCEYHRLYKINT